MFEQDYGEKISKKYQKKYPMALDATNSLFHHYKVKDLPTLIIVKNDEILFKTSDFSDIKLIKEQLSKL